jgi:hypothetical protein
MPKPRSAPICASHGHPLRLNHEEPDMTLESQPIGRSQHPMDELAFDPLQADLPGMQGPPKAPSCGLRNGVP